MFTCVVFCEIFVGDDKAVCCDSCNKWVHVSYDPAQSDSLYNYMVQNPSNEPWFCLKCCGATGSHPVTPISPAGNIHCAVMNVCSIVEKRFDLCAYLATYQFDVLDVTETFLDDSIHDSSIAPFGYLIYCRDRNIHGGGVLILKKSTFSVIRCSDLDLSSEILWIELVSQNQCPLLFGVLYRPPSANSSVLDQLYGVLCTLTSSRCNIVLCGDFNVPNIN